MAHRAPSRRKLCTLCMPIFHLMPCQSLAHRLKSCLSPGLCFTAATLAALASANASNVPARRGAPMHHLTLHILSGNLWEVCRQSSRQCLSLTLLRPGPLSSKRIRPALHSICLVECLLFVLAWLGHLRWFPWGDSPTFEAGTSGPQRDGRAST